MRFSDRHAAGRLLAGHLLPLVDRDTVVLAIPKGGVPVAYEVAGALGGPLDVVCVAKIGAPPLRDWALGAVAEGGVVLLSPEASGRMPTTEAELERIVTRKTDEVTWMVTSYRGGDPLEVEDRSVLVVDDGVATGRTATAAAHALAKLHPGRLVLAVPVGPRDVISDLAQVYDEVHCLFEPEAMQSIGTWYDDYHEVRDIQVRTLLTAARPEA